MNSVERVTTDLAIANRILAEHGVLDEAGHVSVRHPLNPDHYLMAGSHGPTHILPHDLVVFALDGRPITEGKQLLCKERFAHAAVYEARPDIHAVLYACSEDILPFTISDTPFRPVIGPVGDMGTQIPVWDISKTFGDRTDLSVSSLERGRELAKCLDAHRVVLMRGVGFLATGRTLNDLVRMSVYIPKNARSLASSLAIGKTRSLSQGETRARVAIDPESNAMRRGWEYWARKAGCAHLMAE
jgi:HCOMODA/2-hydroxy-3-carboxy-muconic semialdehyde decarboxylase